MRLLLSNPNPRPSTECEDIAHKANLMSPQLQQVLQRLGVVRKSKDLGALVALANDVEHSLKRNRDDYLVFLLQATSILGSIDFQNHPEQQALIRRFTDLADVSHGPVAVEMEVQFLQYAEHAYEGQPNAGSKRRELAARWLQALQRIDDEVQLKFNVVDMPVLNVPPPAGVNLPPGADPQAIQDLDLRAQYEAAITKNAEKANAYGRQKMLQDLRGRFSKIGERFIVMAYVGATDGTHELKKYLSINSRDAARTERLLRALGDQ